MTAWRSSPWSPASPRADHISHLATIVIAASIILHSSTDVLIAKWFKRLLAAPRRDKVNLSLRSLSLFRVRLGCPRHDERNIAQRLIAEEIFSEDAQRAIARRDS